MRAKIRTHQTPTNQWISRGDQQSYPSGTTQTVRKRQGPMARRTSRSTMGLQVHLPVNNKRVPIQASLRGKRHDIRQNWRTIPAPRTIWPNPQPSKHGHSPRPPTRTQKKAQIRNLAAKERAAKKYNANLCPRSFIKRDLVWRMANSVRKKDDKFSANWDDPYRICEDAGGGHIA